ncbi:MAG: hypothetical protein RBT57_01765 [Paludibacter sp.]|jgi:hypothetical protein|nr:hypothetical protein [Paludibacter sp.]
MKAYILSIVIAALTLSGLHAQQGFDDVYFKPSEARKEAMKATTKKPAKPNYKNGAREIIYIQDADTSLLVAVGDSLYLLSEMNDSLYLGSNQQQEEDGYYLNGFEGDKNQYEYAERIRRFHNPKYTIHISDPQYTDIYFLNSNDWNVYVDGSYAWVTPTWTNPFWDNYFWRPYSYNSWYWRHSIWSPSIYSYWSNPWFNHYAGFGGFNHGYYGGYGGYYGGFYGGWNDYYTYYGGHFPHWGSNISYQQPRNKNYNEQTRREQNFNGSSRHTTSGSSVRVAGDRPIQTVSRGSVASSDRTVRVNNSNSTVISRNGVSTVPRQDNTTVRTGTTLRSGISTNQQSTGRRSEEIINTRPRTTVDNSTATNRGTSATQRPAATTRSSGTSTNRGSYSSSVRSSSPSSGSGGSYRSSSSSESSRRSTYTPSNSSSSSTVRSSTPSYSGGSSSSSSSSSSSGSSRSSGGGGGRR